MVLAVQSRPHTMHAAIRGMGGAVLTRGNLTLVIDEVGLFINHRSKEATGVDAWVRLFRHGRELPVDPHRIFINPPLIHNRLYDPRTAFEVILWDSVINVPNPKGWRTRGTVTTVYAGTADDGVVNRSGTTYSGTRAGTSGTKLVQSSADWNDDNLVIEIGQQNTAGNDFYIWEGFISFDTSSIADGDAVSAAALGLVENTGYGTNFSDSDTLEARTYDWGASVTTADWRTGAQYAALTLLASLASGSWSSSGYNTLTENGTNFQSAINKTGTTYIILGTADLAAGTSPSNNTGALWSIMSANNTGTTNDPKLVVTHAAAGPTEVALAGVLPAMSGNLDWNAFIGLAGSLPAQSGAVAFQQRVFPTGVLPAMTGSLQLAASIALAGSLPGMSGAVVGEIAVAIELAGALPAMSGALQLAAAIALTGNLPPQTGVLQLAASIALSGVLPAQSGVVAGSYRIPVLGSLPAMSGAVAQLYQIALAGILPAMAGNLDWDAMIALAGSLPSQSGAVAAGSSVGVAGVLPSMSGLLQLAATIATRGNLPAMSGNLDWNAFIALAGNLPAQSGAIDFAQRISVAGSLPAMSGALDWDALIHVLGNLPAMVGTLGIDATIALLGSLPAQSGVVTFDSIVSLAGVLPAQSGFVYATPVIPDQSHRRKVLMLDGRRR